MSIIDTLITDRSAADTAALEALFAKVKAGTITEEEWAILADPAHKGAYNCTDLNRVTTALEYLRGVLVGYGYTPGGYVLLDRVWNEGDKPTPVQMRQYLANVAAIRNTLAVSPTTPTAPSDMDDDLTAAEANAIEKILVDVETVIKAMERVFLYSGQPMLFSGFAIYPRRPAPIRMPVITADDLNVYTADGLPVFMEEIIYG